MSLILTKFHPFSKLKVLGTPWHGLAQWSENFGIDEIEVDTPAGVKLIPLPNTATMVSSRETILGDMVKGRVYKVEFPGTTAVSRTAQQVIDDTAAGYQWWHDKGIVVQPSNQLLWSLMNGLTYSRPNTPPSSIVSGYTEAGYSTTSTVWYFVDNDNHMCSAHLYRSTGTDARDVNYDNTTGDAAYRVVIYDHDYWKTDPSMPANDRWDYVDLSLSDIGFVAGLNDEDLNFFFVVIEDIGDSGRKVVLKYLGTNTNSTTGLGFNRDHVQELNNAPGALVRNASSYLTLTLDGNNIDGYTGSLTLSYSQQTALGTVSSNQDVGTVGNVETLTYEGTLTNAIVGVIIDETDTIRPVYVTRVGNYEFKTTHDGGGTPLVTRHQQTHHTEITMSCNGHTLTSRSMDFVLDVNWGGSLDLDETWNSPFATARTISITGSGPTAGSTVFNPGERTYGYNYYHPHIPDQTNDAFTSFWFSRLTRIHSRYYAPDGGPVSPPDYESIECYPARLENTVWGLAEQTSGAMHWIVYTPGGDEQTAYGYLTVLQPGFSYNDDYYPAPDSHTYVDFLTVNEVREIEQDTLMTAQVRLPYAPYNPVDGEIYLGPTPFGTPDQLNWYI